MTEDEIVDIALENLKKNAGIPGNWDNHGERELDGKLELIIDHLPVKFNTEIKQELRDHQLPKIIEQAKRFTPLMIVANRIFPKIKEELRLNEIAYLETNGNIWLKQKGLLIWMDTQKPLPHIKRNANRAFTKTGLKVLFHFLLHENDINLPYREIANITQVGLGNINYVINGLKEMGFLIKLNKDKYKLINKKELLDKWVTAYVERLKPALQISTFHFLKQEDFNDWKNLPIHIGKTYWGGEPAGDLLTNYLRPAELTLYTTETRNELIKNYRLIPDEKGNIKVFKKFWRQENANENLVPPLLVYADLITTYDRRNTETAQKIYDEFLQNKL
ncbi:MAG: type IV toxin-antitoxin system AbiEi family antitoxin [Ginsengibacter sp.]